MACDKREGEKCSRREMGGRKGESAWIWKISFSLHAEHWVQLWTHLHHNIFYCTWCLLLVKACAAQKSGAVPFTGKPQYTGKNWRARVIYCRTGPSISNFFLIKIRVWKLFKCLFHPFKLKLRSLCSTISKIKVLIYSCVLKFPVMYFSHKK